jgi:pantoate--beta-alanine ligase|tara:strand:+ start:124 stop:999 length:876 start_codon:yes stop_codon:yes gene_type:complete
LEIINNISLLRKTISEVKESNKSIGFVPTMGSLHQGHLSLFKKSVLENDYTICSIYVNPTQFNNSQDFETYPRTNNKDVELLNSINCDLLFLPTDREMYPEDERSKDYRFTEKINLLEGEKRPGHFLGVITIVHKLFSLVQPNKAYFGEKDYQQLWIIKLFTKEFKLPIKIISCPTIRGENGLALSSRNNNLSCSEKKDAGKLFEALVFFKTELEKIKYNSSYCTPLSLINTKKNALASIKKNPLIKLDYFEVIDEENFSFANDINYDRNYRILIAAYIGEIRLIDNMSLQ